MTIMIGKAVAAAAAVCLSATGVAVAQTKTPPTFTEIHGAPNPVRAGHSFTVTALECDRVADVHATGRMTFVDVTTKKKLGTVTLTPSRKFVNCGQARLTDHEKLRAGKYKIRATYLPGGRVPIRASTPAAYKETVRHRK
jgi:hypothetical protein